MFDWNKHEREKLLTHITLPGMFCLGNIPEGSLFQFDLCTIYRLDKVLRGPNKIVVNTMCSRYKFRMGKKQWIFDSIHLDCYWDPLIQVNMIMEIDGNQQESEDDIG